MWHVPYSVLETSKRVHRGMGDAEEADEVGGKV